MHMMDRTASSATAATAPGVDEITPRQREVLALLVVGKTNKEIARSLRISPFTVRVHVSAVLRHFRVARRRDLAALARDHGPLSDRPSAPAVGSSRVSADQSLVTGSSGRSQRWKKSFAGGGWAQSLVVAGVAVFAVLAGVLTSVPAPARSDNIVLSGVTLQPTAAWAAANVEPDAFRLQTPGGDASAEILVEVMQIPPMPRSEAFFVFAEARMREELSASGMAKHRFDATRINGVECLGYAGVSHASDKPAATAYTHSKGYLCKHPSRPRTAVQISAVVPEKSHNFANSEALIHLLRDLRASASFTP